ncbi:MAG: hypothetical protein FD153_893 [Rhodospirillaceae bacterium]|nr:MAG: hypothetical protein FD153_893 [Rhodospirillaceae bacterium]
MLGTEGVKTLIRTLSGQPLRQHVMAIANAVSRPLLRDDLTLLAIGCALL